MRQLKDIEDSYIRRLNRVFKNLKKEAKEINKNIDIFIKAGRLDSNNFTLLNFGINYKGYGALVIRMKDYWEDDDVIEFTIEESYIMQEKYDLLPDIIKIFEKVAGCKVEINNKK